MDLISVIHLILIITFPSRLALPYSATSYYYYFYDWEIEEKCESPLIPIYINVNELPIANFTYNIEGNIVSF